MSHLQSAYQDGEPAEFYQAVLVTLTDAGIPFAVGGTYAMEELAGLVRQTKDLDLFVRRDDWPRINDTLAEAGIASHIEFAHWLAKATRNDLFVDLIFGSGNGLARVDDAWIARAALGSVHGVPARICAAEEMIWSKSFVMERERFDGADVLHILRHSGGELDWAHLLNRFGEHAGVLLAHLVLFQYVYPDARAQVPAWVLDDIRVRPAAAAAVADRVCRGTLLSRTQYLVDVHGWGYADARLEPHGNMTEDEVVAWTAPIEPASVPSPV
jgi:aminoglycoside-2''-adenylyltransferase